MKELEIYIELCYKAKDKLVIFDRLMNNADFKSLVLTDYLTTYALTCLERAVVDPRFMESCKATGFTKAWLTEERAKLVNLISAIPAAEHDLLILNQSKL